MIIIGTFEYSLDLELLLASLENNLIPRKYIMAVPMDIDSNSPFQFENKKRELSYKGTEVGFASATGLSVIGASAGFGFAWGPIIWGLIGAAIGFLMGFCSYVLHHKIRIYKNSPDKLPEVTVIVQCEAEQFKPIVNTMWKHGALSVGKKL